ncbi:hypothetical protein Bbelb_187300 [Branchiostoma belcheri]|nr:hypothetical protein Bbelb_187300 [Branchiostoma belcheri]
MSKESGAKTTLREDCQQCARKGKSSEYLNTFNRTLETHNYSTRHSMNQSLRLPKARLECGKRTFAYRGAVGWNKLPPGVRTATSIQTFRTLYKINPPRPNFCRYSFLTVMPGQYGSSWWHAILTLDFGCWLNKSKRTDSANTPVAMPSLAVPNMMAGLEDMSNVKPRSVDYAALKKEAHMFPMKLQASACQTGAERGMNANTTTWECSIETPRGGRTAPLAPNGDSPIPYGLRVGNSIVCIRYLGQHDKYRPALAVPEGKRKMQCQSASNSHWGIYSEGGTQSSTATPLEPSMAGEYKRLGREECDSKTKKERKTAPPPRWR